MRKRPAGIKKGEGWGSLVRENDEDYILEGDLAWITVKNLSVMIKKDDEGVSVEIYPKGKEDEDLIVETWATYGEGL